MSRAAGRLCRPMEAATTDLIGEKRLQGNRAGVLIVEYGSGRCVPLLCTTIGCDEMALQNQGEFA